MRPLLSLFRRFLVSIAAPRRAAISLWLTVLAGGPLSAHLVWIEELPDHTLGVRFGEFGEHFETSPGYLDALTEPAAWTPGPAGKPVALTVTKTKDAFSLAREKETKESQEAAAALKKVTDEPVAEAEAAAPATGEEPPLPPVAQIETGFPVMKRARGEGPAVARKPIFYARWQRPGSTAGVPATTLDLVPTGTADEVRVVFRGQPLPQAKLRLHFPEGRSVALEADDHGLVKITTDGPGVYLLALSGHSEPQAGFSAGEAYDVLSHNASLTWRKE